MCQQLLTELRNYLDFLEAHATHNPGLQPGDIAQIKPDADPVFGGVVIRITRIASPHQVRGYLLRAHCAGSPEAWYRFPPSSLTRLAHLPHPEAEWATRTSGLILCPRCHHITDDPWRP